MGKRHRSAWEIGHGESECVKYWKWRVRRLESRTPIVVFAAFITGAVIGAFVFHITR